MSQNEQSKQVPEGVSLVGQMPEGFFLGEADVQPQEVKPAEGLGNKAMDVSRGVFFAESPDVPEADPSDYFGKDTINFGSGVVDPQAGIGGWFDPQGQEGQVSSGEAIGERKVDPRTSEIDRQKVEDAANAVRGLLERQGYDLSSVLLWGYDAAREKPAGDEHDLGGGKRLMSLASIQDMFPPELSDDEETIGESWMVNPLKYALEGGTLGVFSKIILGNFVVKEEYPDEGYGTIAVEVTDKEFWSGCMARLGVHLDDEIIVVEVAS